MMMHVVYNEEDLEQFLIFNDDNVINSEVVFQKTFKVRNQKAIGVLRVDDFNLSEFTISLYKKDNKVEIALEKNEEVEPSDHINPYMQIEALGNEVKGLQQAMAELTILLAGGE